MDPRIEAQNALQLAVRNIRGVSSSDYLRIELGAALSFTTCQRDIEDLYDIANQLADKDLTRIPLGHLGEMRDKLVELYRLFTHLKGFNPAGANGPREHDELVAKVSAEVDHLVHMSAPWLVYLAHRDPSGRNQLIALTDRFESGLRVLTEKSSEFDVIMAEARDAAALTAVAAHEAVFETAHTNYEKSSEAWLRWSVVAIIGTIAVTALLVFVMPLDKDATNALITRYLLIRIVVISFAVYAVSFTVNNYRATTHLRVVNEHRRNALKTFAAFAAAAHDPVTKDAVLLEATRSIFVQGNTGYLTGGEDDASPSRVVEMVKMFSGKGP